MRLRSLQLRNFRGFEQLDLTFHDRLTVLVGVNGSGKTSVLDALAAILRRYSPLGVGPDVVGDLRNGCSEGLISAHFVHGGDYRPSILLTPTGSKAKKFGNALVSAGFAAGTYPIACSFSVSRNAIDQTPGTTSPRTWTREQAWENAFNARASFGELFVWFRECEDAENEIRTEDPEFRDPQLVAVRTAIERLLPGLSTTSEAV
jgi:energy-coupling factor transporter ATP-binding protein EcfA2